MMAEAVFAFGLVAFGFLGMGPVTIAVDSYGPVTDNAQSVYELSLIENVPNVKEEIKKDFGFDPDFENGKRLLEENDGAGNTFKATAKPVLIGTAVVGATTLIFSIIMMLTHGLQAEEVINLSIMHAPFLLGLITGGAVIYWFSGASTQAVSTGAYRAVQFIKANIKLEGVEKASVEDSKKVVEICTIYAQKGMFNIFLVVFFSTLAFAFVEPYFFIGYLISIALFGLYQAIFMANAGGAWDNAKKLVETELNEKGTELHAACVVGDTVGDPFKDTSSVAMNPIIKFTTLFGLLAVELAVKLDNGGLKGALAAGFLMVAFVFVYRSFYGMRIPWRTSRRKRRSSPRSQDRTKTRGRGKPLPRFCFSRFCLAVSADGEGVQIRLVQLLGKIAQDGGAPAFLGKIQVAGERAQESDVEALLVAELALVYDVGADGDASRTQDGSIDLDFRGGEGNEEIGFAFGNHGREYLVAETHVAGDRAATLAHAVDFAFFHG